MKLKPRYTLTFLLAAILLVGLPLAWLRRDLDKRQAYVKQVYALTERGATLMIDEKEGNPLEGRTNINSIVGISMGSSKFGDDDLRVLDGLPNLQHVRLYETAVTDEGLLHLARQHPKLERVDLWSYKVTNEGLARFKRERPKVPLDFNFTTQ